MSGHSFLGSSPPGSSNFNFHAGTTVGGTFPFDWPSLEYLARTLQPTSPEASHQIVVACKGGRYSKDNIPNENPSGWDTLFVFNTAEQITIGASTDGRAFGGSILAPFSHVIIEDGTQFVDGVVVAKSLEMSSGGGSVQIHGHCFAGSSEVSCIPGKGASTCEASHTTGVVSCNDMWKVRKCLRKQRKGKCHKRKALRMCQQTCGGCHLTG